MSLNMQSKEQVVKDFQLGGQDTGSVEVQAALLTRKIQQLTDHLQKNPKDFSSKRGLVNSVSLRKKLLKYLKNKNQERYHILIDRLGLKK
ncbi:30S ribosomal protein S15 [Candidatus Dependentiae bacterium]|nr:30S ribosomal protein S15 [Candidatus Dependentiae bacterium]